MRFGELYSSKQKDEYRDHYLNYEYLKNNICNPDFNSLLLIEIEKVETFFTTHQKNTDFIFLNFIAILKILKKYNKNNTEKIDIDLINDKEFYKYLISEKKYVLNNDINNSQCNICYESDSYMIHLSECNHSICWNCLLKMYDNNIRTCPFCRTETNTNPIILKYESLTASKCNPQYYKSMNIKDDHKRLLFLGIDGLRPDCLLFANTPNLDYLIKNGQINFETILQNDAISGQSWATIFKGDNNHDILFNEQLEDDNYSPKDNIISVLNSKNINTISITNSWRGIYNLTKNSKEKVYIDKGHIKSNDDLVLHHTCEEILKNDKKETFIFSYIGGIDKTGHKFGFSMQKEEYIAYIENFDKTLNILLKLIDEYNYSIIVTTDHGGSYYRDSTKIQQNIFRGIPYYAGQVKDKCKGIHGLNIPQHKRTFQIYYGDYETSETLDTLKNTDIYQNILKYYSI
jgi:hypothetical protein